MQESCPYGSVRGVPGNGHSYRNHDQQYPPYFVHVYRGISPRNKVFFPTSAAWLVGLTQARRVFQRDWEIQTLPKDRCFLLQNCGNPAPIYSWFTEGFDTADLQEAKVLLEALA